jgi:hypothetical protein
MSHLKPHPRPVPLFAALAVSAALLVPVSATAQPAPEGCLDANAFLTPEEHRLTRAIGENPQPVAEQILQRSGFDRFEPAFVKALCAADSLGQAERVVTSHGQRLWRTAVDRVQGRGPDGGDLSRSDDRPLYWARLQMTRALRQWQPGFALTDEQRVALDWTLERASRGQFDVRFPAGKGVKRMLVSGFDPFSLDGSQGRAVRNGNPSGAIILSLDGTVVETEQGSVFIEVAIFPVRWRDFDLGMVGDTFGPFMQEGPRRLDASMTISQGGGGMRFEHWNGRFRTGTDNNTINPCGSPALSSRPECQITPPDRWVPFEAPQWTQTTQPIEILLNAGTGPFVVSHNRNGTQFVTCGEPQTQSFSGAPTSLEHCARSGGGGSFLSNEIAYRVTLLRDVFGLSIPAGHNHVASMPLGTTFEITDPSFEARRADIVQQAGALVRVVGVSLLLE